MKSTPKKSKKKAILPLLGVNIDHVATLRQARGGTAPSPKQAALEVMRAGADGITIHLREDRRHIQDRDLLEVQRVAKVPVNLEMSLNPEIVSIALRQAPEKVCLVPEKRQEVTTEGGLNVLKNEKKLAALIPQFKKKKIEVSLFIDPSSEQIETAFRLGADAVELHTGSYANARGSRKEVEFSKLQQGAFFGHKLGLKVNAGHGLDYDNVGPVAAIKEFHELNIGHSIISHAVFVGLYQAVIDMKKSIRKGRH